MYLKPSEYIDTIKSRLTMGDVLNAYGMAVDAHKNRIPCPLHNGKDNNFSFNQKGYRCFVCGKHGDLISFVQEYFSLSFTESIKKLNNDFNLNLPLEKSQGDEQSTNEIRMRHAVNAYRRAEESKASEELRREYWQMRGQYRAYCKQVEKHKPVSPGIYPSDAFFAALKGRADAENKLDEILTELLQWR